MAVSKMTATDIKEALRKKFPENSHALFFEVPNATGYAGTGRIDALVISLWPSRGLTWSGYEIKTSKADLRSELADPQKAEKFAQHLDEWWLITPENLTTGEDIPSAWGVAWVTPAGTIKVIKEAPKLVDVSPIPEAIRPFIASVIRNAAESKKVADLETKLKAQNAKLTQYRKFEKEVGVCVTADALPGRKKSSKKITDKVMKAAQGWREDLEVVQSMKKIVTLSRDLHREVGKIAIRFGIRWI